MEGLEAVPLHEHAARAGAPVAVGGVQKRVQHDRRGAVGAVFLAAPDEREHEPLARGHDGVQEGLLFGAPRLGVAGARERCGEVVARRGVGRRHDAVVEAQERDEPVGRVPQRVGPGDGDAPAHERLVASEATERAVEVRADRVEGHLGVGVRAERGELGGQAPQKDGRLVLLVGVGREERVDEVHEGVRPGVERAGRGEPRERLEQLVDPLGEPAEQVGAVQAGGVARQAAQHQAVRLAAGDAEQQAVQAEAPRVEVVVGQAEGGLARAVEAPADAGLGEPGAHVRQLGLGDAGAAAHGGRVQEVEQLAGRQAAVAQAQRLAEGLEHAQRRRVRVLHHVDGQAHAAGGLGHEHGVHERRVGVQVRHHDQAVVRAQAVHRVERVEQVVA